MKKQAVLSVMLIFLFTVLLLYTGLTVAESALQQVAGVVKTPMALALWRGESGKWVLTFAGRSLQVDRGIWRVFYSQDVK